MADHLVIARDELHESEAGWAQCFVLTMLPQKRLASSTIWSVLFRYSNEFLCSSMPPEGGERLFSVSPFASEGKTDEGKEFRIAERTVKVVCYISHWKFLENV